MKYYIKHATMSDWYFREAYHQDGSLKIMWTQRESQAYCTEDPSMIKWFRKQLLAHYEKGHRSLGIYE